MDDEKMAVIEETADHTRRSHGIDWSLNYIKNLPAMLKNTPIDALFGKFECFRNSPVIIVGAGPSLAKNIDVLKKAQGKAYIIASATAYKPLHRAGIRPDVVMVAEKVPMDEYFDVPGMPFVRLFVNDVAHPSLHTRLSKGTFTVFGDRGSALNKRFARHLGSHQPISSGGNVTTQMLSIAYFMGFKDIIFVGHDLAYGEGRAYCPGVVYEEKEIIYKGDTMREVGTYNGKHYVADRGLCWVPSLEGYSRGHRITSRSDWASFLVWMEGYLELNSDPAIKVINATQGGAYIRGMYHMTLRTALERTTTEDSTHHWPSFDPPPDTCEFPLERRYIIKELSKMEKLLGAIGNIAVNQIEPDAAAENYEEVLYPIIKKADFMHEALPSIKMDLKGVLTPENLVERNGAIITYIGLMMPELIAVRKELEHDDRQEV